MKIGLPAITKASIKNIFFILAGVKPMDKYWANSRFLCRKNPNVLENTFAIPITASKPQKEPRMI